MIKIMFRNRLKALLTGVLMACCAFTARAQEEIIEHEGNKYTIHVERLNPDAEMTLLDVLHICPELMSSDGKTLTANYLLSVDDIMLSVDYELLLEGIKACDLSEVTVCTYGAVNNAMDGITGSIDLTFKEGEGMTGKLDLSGSTYGNGRLYADVASRGKNVTVRAFAQTKLQYGQAESLSGTNITSRNGVENAMLFVDWQATENDLLKLKLSQGYDECKDRLRNPFYSDDDTELNRQRWYELVTTYERTLNEQGAGLYFEAGIDYASNDLYLWKQRTTLPWWIAECSFPLLKQSLWVTAGYEGGYTNLWSLGLRREQNLYNDLYVKLDYKKGPWIISVGDRFRRNCFWDKHYNEDHEELWSYSRNDHALLASVGYRKGRHFVQGTFSRSFFNPMPSDFHEYLDVVVHNTDYKTNLAWRSEARYTYQTKQLVATGSVTHMLLTDMITPDESLTGLNTSVTWHQGALRLTAGANVYFQHYSLEDPIDDTYFILKLNPILLLGKGFRLSSVLLYNSSQDIYDQHAHLYASVKMNKDFGKRCNVFADFHDIAGQLKGETYNLRQSFRNRALTVGLIYYPWR